MRISIAEAEGQLTELVRLASQGEEVVLTQDGNAAARLEPVKKILSPAEKSQIIDRIQEQVRKKNLPAGPDAAHSQDFLYDEFGHPK
jgi:prevent-host-death family protein